MPLLSLSSHSSLPLFTLPPFYSDHFFISAPLHPLDSIVSSLPLPSLPLSFPLSALNSNRPRTQRAVWCALAGLCATQDSSISYMRKRTVLLLIHGLYLQKVKYVTLTMKVLCVTSEGMVCACLCVLECFIRCRLNRVIWVMKSWWSFRNESIPDRTALLNVDTHCYECM